jgi:hypothetical protein
VKSATSFTASTVENVGPSMWVRLVGKPEIDLSNNVSTACNSKFVYNKIHNNVDIVDQFDHYEIVPLISDVNLTQSDTVIQEGM